MKTEDVYRLQKILDLGDMLLPLDVLAEEINRCNGNDKKIETKKQQKQILKKELYRYGILSPETLSIKKLTKQFGESEYFVYMIQQKGGGEFVKIGMSNDVDKRIKILQTASPHKLEVIARFPVKNKQHAIALEKALHNRLRKYRASGEWFESEALRVLRINAH